MDIADDEDGVTTGRILGVIEGSDASANRLLSNLATFEPAQVSIFIFNFH